MIALRDATLSKKRVQQTADEILDVLPVTDRVYHHLDYWKPLVVELATRVERAQRPGDRVLLVGSDSLLPLVLLRLGYQVDLWHFEDGHLVDEVKQRVRRVVRLEDLERGDVPEVEATYDAIVVPLVLDGISTSAKHLLSSLRRLLGPDGSLIIATGNERSIDLRLLAAFGQSSAHKYPERHVSLSFPPLPRRRRYQRNDLVSICEGAGLRTLESACVIGHPACSRIDPYAPLPYLALQLQHQVARLVPTARHVLLMHLTHRIGDEDATERDWDGSLGDDPFVSVVVGTTNGSGDVERTLRSLIEQEYPANKYEVLVLHDRRSERVIETINRVAAESAVRIRPVVVEEAEGPHARDAAVLEATGDICVHTDDLSRPPLGWIRTIVAAFGDRVGAVTGPVSEEDGSHPEFFVLPGSRPRWDHQGLFPVANVAHRRSPLVAMGGFGNGSRNGHGNRLGWDTELAWRLEELGWGKRHVREAFLYRLYPAPNRLSWIGQEWNASQELPAMIARVPRLGDHLLVYRHFAARRTLIFDMMVAGVAAALLFRRRRWLVLTLPWLGYCRTLFDFWPLSAWRPSSRRLFAVTTRHVIWAIGLIVGSIRARRLVL